MNQESYILPTSFSQQQLWFLDKLNPNSAVYNIPWQIKLQGTLDVAILQQTLQTIVDRHETLRTTFTEVDGNPMQVISDNTVVTIPTIDLTTELAQTQAATVAQLVKAEAEKPFDLNQGPLLRAQLLHLDNGRYLLLLTVHHIVFDGWSQQLFFKELKTIYTALTTGQTPTLPELPIQYADYAHWQQQLLEAGQFAEELDYWQTQLAELTTLALPVDHAYPSRQTYAGARQTLPLSSALKEQLQTVAREEGATLFMTLLATFKLLLHRYTQQTDIVIGTPSANRSQAEIANLVGFFVNMLVLRTDISEAPSFRQLLQQVRQTTVDAFTHQNVPFEKLVETLHVEPQLDRSPLFQVTFATQKVAPTDTDIPDLQLEVIENYNGASKFTLSFNILEEAEGLTAVAVYNTDLFDDETITRLLHHYQQLLTQIVANPNGRLSQFDILTAAEKETLTHDWNATELAYPMPTFVPQLVAAQAKATPEAVAVASHEATLTYQALNEQANQLAHYLQRQGVGPEVKVGICLPRTAQLIVAQLAVLKVGGAFVSLDINAPKDRLTYMIEDAKMALLIANSSFDTQLPAPVTRIIPIDTQNFTDEAKTSPHLTLSPKNLAYIIYTSGSTGKPKGVTLTHEGLINLVKWHEATFNINEADRMSQLAAPAFDASVWEIWPPLTIGASLHIPKEATRHSPTALLQWLADEQVSISFIPTALAEAAMAEPWPSHTTLRTLLVGGDRLHQAPAPSLPPTLYNNYGPTETTVVATMTPITAEDTAKIPPIGRPVANARLYVLDAAFNQVPIGVVGELFIGGTGVARGYLDRPGLTAVSFIPDPFSGQVGQRLYRTGDLVRYQADGQVEFIGRADHQVQIRGFRIELAEIEVALQTHPMVIEAVVDTQPTPHGDKQLVAYLVLQADDFNVNELRQHLHDQLPDYMIPATFATLSALPITSNGKVDRKRLLEMTVTWVENETEYVPPRNVLETDIAGIWAQVLSLAKEDDSHTIGVYDNFFHLGGHSLLATQIVSRVHEQLNVELSLLEFFDNPTIAGLAQAMTGEAATESNAADKGTMLIQPLADRELMPLSYTQQRIWFLQKLEPDTPFYNIAMAVELSGNLNIAALRQSLNTILQRHEVLRTTFTVIDDQPYQQILDTQQFDLPLQKLTTDSEAKQNERIQAMALAEATAPFDLSNGALWRGRLLEVAPDKHIFLLTIHHIISDGWSMGILFEELAALYSTYTKGEVPALAPLSIQYADYAHWQKEWLQGDNQAELLRYWKAQFAEANTTLNLPTDYTRPVLQTFQGAQKVVHFSPEQVDALQALSSKEGATLFMTMLTALNILLYRYTQQTDIIIGTPVANRTQQAVEGVMGCFLNTLALRTDLSQNPTFRDLLARVRQTALAAYAHQALPFEKLIEELHLPRDMSRNPLFQVMFDLQDADIAKLTFKDVELRPLTVDIGIAQFDLSMSARRGPQGIKMYCEYNTALFSDETITRLLQQYQTLIDSIIQNPDQHLATIPILPHNERQLLLSDWVSNSKVPYEEACIHHLFEAQVAQAPQQIALVAGEQTFTYDSLNKQANQLAHHLQSVGVGPESVVGLYMERSPHMLWSLLAILKAGAAYLPLDPALPEERLTFILQDTRPTHLLTQTPLQTQLPHYNHCPTICVDDLNLAETSTENPSVAVNPQNIAYVIYTSGSTGQPKGVLMPHKALINHSLATKEAYQLRPTDRGLQFAALHFDVILEEVFPFWLAGATVVLLPDQEVTTLTEFSHFITRQQLTALNLPASYWHEWVSVLAKNGTPLPTSLRLLVTGTEAILPQRLSQWQQIAGDRVAWFNAYGLTETTITSTLFELPEKTAVNEQPIPIGKPLNNVTCYVLDSHLQPLPIGVPGELYIGGAGVARGYLNRPQTTADRFIPNPFSKQGGAHLYRTGDVVRYLADGNIEFMGRADKQIKVRGYRIEPAEIEQLLRQYPQVEDAVVFAVPTAAGPNQQLTACLVSTAAQTLDINNVRQFLGNKLPKYMVPTHYTTLDKLPLLPNGKINYHDLPKVGEGRTQLNTEYLAPTDALERTIATVWQTALQIDEVGIYDNFFDLGGHSILMLQIQAELQRLLVQDVPLMDMFKYPTIHALAKSLSREESEQLTFAARQSRGRNRGQATNQRREYRRQRRAERKSQGAS